MQSPAPKGNHQQAKWATILWFTQVLSGSHGLIYIDWNRYLAQQSWDLQTTTDYRCRVPSVSLIVITSVSDSHSLSGGDRLGFWRYLSPARIGLILTYQNTNVLTRAMKLLFLRIFTQSSSLELQRQTWRQFTGWSCLAKRVRKRFLSEELRQHFMASTVKW